jgi:hypothetical protein
MTMENMSLGSLSAATSKRINWAVLESIVGTVVQQARRPGAPTGMEPLTAEDRESARRAFLAVREEFDKTLIWLRKTIRVAMAGIIGAAAAAVVSAVIVQVTPWASLVSMASAGSLFGFIPKAISLARDQVMLELVPSRYSLALELCATRKDLSLLVARFLEETSSLRKR